LPADVRAHRRLRAQDHAPGVRRARAQAGVNQRAAGQCDPARARHQEKEAKTMHASQLELHAHLKIRPGQLEGFKKQAAECMRVAREVDTRTLRYDWFISRDGTQCEVHEAYVNSEGMIEHSHNIAEVRGKLFAEFAEDHFMTFYGEVSPELFDM